MRLLLLLLASLLADPVAAGPATQASQTEDTTRSELPVSLDRIREGLARPPQGPLLGSLDKEPDFRVEIQERQRFEELLKRLTVEPPGPVPPGGVYAYEQQQRLFNPTHRPLMQPYAAFSPRELTIVALENIIGQYVARKLIGALGSAARAEAERAARAEVRQAIVTYCAVQPGGGAGIEICTFAP
jgi:hypothetical protein